MKQILYILLYPLSLLYGFITWLRNRLYDTNFLKPFVFDKTKVIAIGNLCAGGSGKTPMSDYIAQLLKSETKVAVLSRGYKRKTDGFVLANEHSTSDQIGDEPMLLHLKHQDIVVAVDAKRKRGIEKLQKLIDAPEVVVLDDAFQHRSVKPGMSILLTEYSNLYIHDFMLPSGRLREFKEGAIRADIIIVTKTPQHATGIEIRSVIKDIKPLPYQQLFFSYINYGKLVHIFNHKNQIELEQELYKYSVLLVTGIANNKDLFTYVKEYANEVKALSYADHFDYTAEHIQQIKNQFSSLQGDFKIIITTEKDAVKFNSEKLKTLLEDLPMYVLPIEMDFKTKTEEFNELILKYVRTNKIYHAKYSAGN